jgi:preprotein translocase subunit SecF
VGISHERTVMSSPAVDVEPTPQHRRPWGWIIASFVLLVTVVGLVIWATGLQSDLDDQKTATKQAQEEAAAANAQVEDLSSEVGAISQSVADATTKLQQAGATASANVETAQANAQQAVTDAQTALAGVKTKADSAQAKAQKAVDKVRSALKNAKAALAGSDSDPPAQDK